ncbi:4-sulfomuconolactone hydrolase [Usitatibacter rugosus]|uniref:4-sulfomuconolactone hydrolase n=1 Tax=Usitatibacter rugosus TaxID=2732067 RepID=A0A6M4GY95_9PROT|nr:amidohydrolase family protein [Usitatibacter rugosus]QJR11363.1 4-sulfomuconolactone hydrolase [Usitatibacter rugosus]
MGSRAYDTHAHVWHGPLRLIEGARHRPTHDAPVDAFIAHLDRHALGGGLLIQPSFLGTDNSLMLEAVRRYPHRLKAVAVVNPAIDAAALDALAKDNVVGVRYNLIGLPLPDFASGPYPEFHRELARRRWHVELHRESGDLPRLLHTLVAQGVRIAVDHFGRCYSPDDAGFRHLLGLGPSGNVWVKVSGAYRCGGDATGTALTQRLLDAFAPDRLLWGSDWPHTQHESLATYDSTYALFERSIPDAAVRKRILEEAPAALFGDT